MYALTARIAGRRARREVAVTPESLIALALEPANPADPEAIAVFADGERAGYLEAGLARLVRPLLLRERPVRVIAQEGGQSLTVWIPGRSERIGRNLVEVASSDGRRTYLVDRKGGRCTCPAGRYGWCKHRTQARAKRPVRSASPVVTAPLDEAATSVSTSA